MTTETREKVAFSPVALEYFKPPFTYDLMGQSVFGEGVNGRSKCLDIRGWGNLTGGGANNLPQEQVEHIHDEFGQWVCDAMNAYARTPAAPAVSEAGANDRAEALDLVTRLRSHEMTRVLHLYDRDYQQKTLRAFQFIETALQPPAPSVSEQQDWQHGWDAAMHWCEHHDLIKDDVTIPKYEVPIQPPAPITEPQDAKERAEDDRNYNQQLLDDLVTCHISAFLGGDKMPKVDASACRNFTYKTCIRAAQFVRDHTERASPPARIDEPVNLVPSWLDPECKVIPEPDIGDLCAALVALSGANECGISFMEETIFSACEQHANTIAFAQKWMKNNDK
jgi:hypothetical protein